MSRPLGTVPPQTREQSQLQRDRAELRDLDAELGLAPIPIELRARLSSALKAFDAMLLSEWYASERGQTPAIEQALQLWRTERRRIRRRAPDLCPSCPHPAHLGPCSARNGQSANPCPCLRSTLSGQATPSDLE